MDGAVFGSYSVTEFTDLYYLNVRDNHHYSFFFEVSPDGVVGLRQGKIDDIRKNDNRNFLIGVLSDDIDNVTIERDILEYFETPHVLRRDINYLVDTKKEFIYFSYEESKVIFATTKNIRFYVSENRSFSTVPPSGYTEIRPNLVYSMPIFKDRSFNTDPSELAS